MITISTLPQELLEVIFDLLEDDKAALSTCSSVCRCWASGAQRYLFRRTHLRLPHFGEANTNEEDETRLLPFVQFLKNSPCISSSIQHLSLCARWLYRAPRMVSNRQVYISLRLSVMFELLQNLPNLTSLSLRSLRLVSHENVGNGLLAYGPIHSIKELRLNTVTGYASESQDHHSLLDFLGLFATIQSLTMTSFSATEINVDSLVEFVHKVKISRILAIRMRDYHIFGQILDKIADVRSITHCGVSLMVPQDLEPHTNVVRFLSNLNKGQLEVMELDLRWLEDWPENDTEAFLHNPNLPTYHSISSIVIHFCVLTPYRDQSQAIRWRRVLSLLSTLPTHKLSDITLHLHFQWSTVRGQPPCTDPNDVLRVDWALLNSVVISMKHFRKFTLYVALQDEFDDPIERSNIKPFAGHGRLTPSEIFESVKENIESALENLHSKNRLEVLWQQSTWQTMRLC